MSRLRDWAVRARTATAGIRGNNPARINDALLAGPLSLASDTEAAAGVSREATERLLVRMAGMELVRESRQPLRCAVASCHRIFYDFRDDRRSFDLPPPGGQKHDENPVAPASQEYRATITQSENGRTAMKKILILTSALGFAAFSAGAEQITVMSFGGAYGASQMEAYHKPYMAETGVSINSIDADNPATPLKAQVEAGNVTVDVADLEPSDLVRLCDEGALEVLPLDELPPSPDGATWQEDFMEGGIYECGVGTIAYSTAIAYNAANTKGVTSAADFFDLEAFPGKRGLRKSAKLTLELALMADGVEPEDVYDVMGTPEGVNRAFAKLDTIKPDIIWWEAGAQPPQLLADGEVTMSTAYNGRIFNAMIEENQPLEVLWDKQILDFNLYVIPKGAPNRDAAWEFIKYATGTQRLADQARFISYGPVRKSSMALVGKFKDGVTDMAPHLPTAPENMKTALTTNVEFWADHDAELTERFNTWLASN